MGSSLSSGSPVFGYGQVFGPGFVQHQHHVGMVDGLISAFVQADAVVPTLSSSQIQQFFLVVYVPLFMLIGLSWSSYSLVQLVVGSSAEATTLSWVLRDSLGVWRPNVLRLWLALVLDLLVRCINRKPWNTTYSTTTTHYYRNSKGNFMPLESRTPWTKRQTWQKVRQTIGYYWVAAVSDPFHAFFLSTLFRYDLDRRVYAHDLVLAVTKPYDSSMAIITRPATLVHFWDRDEEHLPYWCGFQIRYKLDGVTYLKTFRGYLPLESVFETAEGTHVLHQHQQQGRPMEVKLLPHYPHSALPVFLLDQDFFALSPSSRTTKDRTTPGWLPARRLVEPFLYSAICLYSGFYRYMVSSFTEYHGCWWKWYVDVGLFVLGVAICFLPISYSDHCPTIVQQGHGSLYGFLDMTTTTTTATSRKDKQVVSNRCR